MKLCPIFRALVLCLCLVSCVALSEETNFADAAVTHAQFSLQAKLHPDGFPEPSTRLSDWEIFLQKLTVKGAVDAQNFLNPYSRVYMDAGLYVKDQKRIPFVYDGYHSYRYLISPALKGESLHFQMHNFFDFMLKPYYFLELPTQYLAFLLYPEASYYIIDSYYTPLAQTLQGNGSQTFISYADLLALCEQLNLLVTDDEYYERIYVYFNALLLQAGSGEMLVDKLARLEDLLDYLDPNQEGMTITSIGNKQVYQLGEYQVFEKEQTEKAQSFTLTIPDPDGYLVYLTYAHEIAQSEDTVKLKMLITLEDVERICVDVQGNGLPRDGDVQGQGDVSIAITGELFDQPIQKQTFTFTWIASAATDARTLAVDVGWLHPQTQKEAFSLHLVSDSKPVSASVFKEGVYRQDDFFSLNDYRLVEFKERYFSSLAIAAVPLLVEMPAGVLNDVLEFAVSSGIMGVLE